ncbi:MAG: zf-HC2 domain-containing protein [Chloroflexi bacterium]|nr:zf-HC2 domain-containing protein [Chloroflexota bacterium]
MASVAPSHLDAMTLSFYYDGELDSPERSAVALHLETCSACRQELATLQWFGEAVHRATTPLRVITPARPLQKDTQARDIRRYAIALVAGLMAILVVVVHTVLAVTAPLFAVLPPSGNTRVAVNQALTVSFAHRINEPLFASSLIVQPATPFQLTWEPDGSARIIPLVPWKPWSTYTVSAIVQEAAVGPVATVQPATLAVFRTEDALIAPSAQSSLSIRSRLSNALSLLRSFWHRNPEPSVTSNRSPFSANRAALQQRAGFQEPSSGLGWHSESRCVTISDQRVAKMWQTHADVQNALGCQVQTAQPVSVFIQHFSHGDLLLLPHYHLAIMLSPNGLWLPVGVVKESPNLNASGSNGVSLDQLVNSGIRGVLGSPQSTGYAYPGALLNFAHGFALTTDQGALLLSNSGLWQRISESSSPPSTGQGISPAPRGAPSFSVLIRSPMIFGIRQDSTDVLWLDRWCDQCVDNAPVPWDVATLTKFSSAHHQHIAANTQSLLHWPSEYIERAFQAGSSPFTQESIPRKLGEALPQTTIGSSPRDRESLGWSPGQQQVSDQSMVKPAFTAWPAP